MGSQITRITFMTYVPNLRKIGQKMRSLFGRTVLRTDTQTHRQTYIEVILYLPNAIHCIEQTKYGKKPIS